MAVISPLSGRVVVASDHLDAHIATVEFAAFDRDVREQRAAAVGIRSGDADAHSVKQVGRIARHVVVFGGHVVEVAILDPHVFVVVGVLLPDDQSAEAVGDFQSCNPVASGVDDADSVELRHSGLDPRTILSGTVGSQFDRDIRRSAAFREKGFALPNVSAAEQQAVAGFERDLRGLPQGLDRRLFAQSVIGVVARRGADIIAFAAEGF